MMTDVIAELQATLQERQRRPSPGSYTAQLLTAGEDEIVKKIGEEAIEVVLAAKGQGNQRLVEESADLIYHLLVLLISRELTWADVEAELARRRKPGV
jgi:phosphoribosyl-ATP pyrophosphohydrolase